MKELHRLAHPLFLLSVFLLILNDWYFKTAFHNELTGKLSDFAGLFAFPFFLGALFPKYKRAAHYLTGILFMLWNSEFSQPLIAYFNSFGLPIGRTIDFTDNIALISLIASYKCLGSRDSYELRPVLQAALVFISCSAFLATTMPPRENRKYVNIDKEYEFNFSKRELVSRLNMVQMKEIEGINKLSGLVDFNAETNTFHFHGRTDTLALILDATKLAEQDTLEFKTSYAEIMIRGNESQSALKLLSVFKTLPLHKQKDYKEKAIKHFERRIIKKIRKYR